MQFKNDIEIFDKYQKGRLSEMEQADFEAQLNSSSQLKEAFEEYQMMVKGIQYAERQRLKQELLTSRPTASRSIRSIARHWGRVGIAASLAILVSFGIYFCSNSNDRIYAKYDLGREKVMMDFGTTEQSTSAELFDEAMMLKSNKEFAAALEKLVLIDENDPHRYALSQYNQALIHLKLNNRAEAKFILNELIELPGKHFTKDKAKAMISELNKPCFF